jgi:hypothetical protein
MPRTNPHRSAYEQAYLDWYQGAGTYAGVPFAPEPFAQLIRQQHPHLPNLAAAMLRCTRAWHSEAYSHLVAPNDRRHGSGGAFWLRHPQLGILLVDLARDGAIIGIEYHHRLPSMEDPALEPLEAWLARLAPLTAHLHIVP